MQAGDIDMITTDHSPSTIDLKLLEEGDFLKAWGGISGIQVLHLKFVFHPLNSSNFLMRFI